MKLIRNNIWIEVIDRIDDQIDDQIDHQVGELIQQHVSGQVWGSIDEIIWVQVENQLKNEIYELNK